MCDCRSCLCCPSPSSLEAILSSKAAYVAFSKFARIRFQSWTDSSDTRGRSSLALTLMTSVRDGNADSVVPFPKVSPTDAPITRIMCFSRASCRGHSYTAATARSDFKASAQMSTIVNLIEKTTLSKEGFEDARLSDDTVSQFL